MKPYIRQSMLIGACMAACLLSFVPAFAQNNREVYQQRVVIQYAAPGSNPAQVNGFAWTAPQAGTYQVTIRPNRPSVVIKGLEVPIDVAVGILIPSPRGHYRGRGGRYADGGWRHGTGNTFVTRSFKQGQTVRIWYSSSIGGAPSPDIGGTVIIRRIR